MSRASKGGSTFSSGALHDYELYFDCALSCFGYLASLPITSRIRCFCYPSRLLLPEGHKQCSLRSIHRNPHAPSLYLAVSLLPEASSQPAVRPFVYGLQPNKPSWVWRPGVLRQATMFMALSQQNSYDHPAGVRVPPKAEPRGRSSFCLSRADTRRDGLSGPLRPRLCGGEGLGLRGENVQCRKLRSIRCTGRKAIRCILQATVYSNVESIQFAASSFVSAETLGNRGRMSQR